MEKNNRLHSLHNSKIIIGNGFDLYCGLHTKYIDFSNSRLSRYQTLKEWIKSITKQDCSEKGFLSNRTGLIAQKPWPVGATIWDLLFLLISAHIDSFDKIEISGVLDWSWFNVEKVMLYTFKKDKSYPTAPNLCENFWDKIYQLQLDLQPGFDATFQENICALAFSILPGNHSDKCLFYAELLDELNVFEKRFGSFIYEQYSSPNTKKEYEKNSLHLLFNLLSNGIGSVSSIDSFNYSLPFSDPEMISKLHFINGDYKNPIFGIDSAFIPTSDPAYQFTKTARRLELDMNSNQSDEFVPFSNMIIFGHSLNQQDYSYFFPAFDYLGLTDVSRASKIVFAYSIYDPNKSEEIKKELRERISALFEGYENYLAKTNEHRLLDALTTQRRILMIDVDELQ